MFIAAMRDRGSKLRISVFVGNSRRVKRRAHESGPEHGTCPPAARVGKPLIELIFDARPARVAVFP